MFDDSTQPSSARRAPVCLRGRLGRVLGVALVACWVVPVAHALTADQVRAMSIGENDDRAAAIAQVAATGDAKAPAFFQALLDDAVKTRNYSLEPQMQYTDGKSKVIGYVARQSLEVRVDDLTKIGAFIDAAGGSGATSISDIRYDVKDRSGIETSTSAATVNPGGTTSHRTAMSSSDALPHTPHDDVA